MPSYSFAGTPLPLVESVAAPYAGRVGSASTPGRAGNYTGKQFASERRISVSGTLVAASYDALQTAWSAMQSVHDVSTPQQLVLRDGWYYLATVESISDDEREIGHIRYSATYSCADPYAFSTTLSAPSISTSGGTFSVGGNRPAKPSLSITVSAAPASSSIVITNTTTGTSCTISPNATGTYVLNSLSETVTMNSLNKMAAFSGSFLSLPPGSNTLTISTSGGATVSAASISYRARAI
jgi:phage-related protein